MNAKSVCKESLLTANRGLPCGCIKDLGSRMTAFSVLYIVSKEQVLALVR